MAGCTLSVSCSIDLDNSSVFVDWVGVNVEQMNSTVLQNVQLHSAVVMYELFYSFFLMTFIILVSISVFIALSTVLHSINSPDNSLFSPSVLLVLPLPYWSFQLYLFMKVSFSPDIIPSG